MSDMTFRDRLPDYRNQYNRMKSKAAKGSFLTRLQSAYPISRKLPIKRLSGNRPFKPRKGRGKTFGPEFERLALALHRACGWMFAPYMSALMPCLVKDREALHGALEPTVRGQLLKAGESTLSRRNYGCFMVASCRSKCVYAGRISGRFDESARDCLSDLPSGESLN